MLVCFLVVVTFFAAGLLQGLAGFGFGLLAIPLLLLFLGVKTAVPLSIMSAIAVTAMMSFHLRGHVQLGKLLPLLLGLFPGIAAGVLFLSKADSSVVMFLLGCFILAYAVYSLTASFVSPRLHPAWGVLAGFLTGAISAAFGGGGPPIIVYSQLAGWKREQFRATLAVFFMALTIFSCLGHLMAGLLTGQVLSLLGCSVPAVVLGALVGMKCARRFNEKRFQTMVLVLLSILGGATILQAVM